MRALSGPVFIVILLAIGAAIGLLVRWVASRRRPARTGNASVLGNPSDVLQDLQLATSGVPKVVPRRETPDSLTVEFTYIPGWAFVVALLIFPIGLIALVARSSVTGTVVVRQGSEGRSELRMAGTFHPKTVKAINSVIDVRSQVAAPVLPTPLSPAL